MKRGGTRAVARRDAARPSLATREEAPTMVPSQNLLDAPRRPETSSVLVREEGEGGPGTIRVGAGLEGGKPMRPSSHFVVPTAVGTWGPLDVKNTCHEKISYGCTRTKVGGCLGHTLGPKEREGVLPLNMCFVGVPAKLWTRGWETKPQHGRSRGSKPQHGAPDLRSPLGRQNAPLTSGTNP